MSDDVAANIQNPKDRLAIILERNQETYIDRVENKLTEIFSVKILSGTPEGTMERNKGTIHGHANGKYYHCRVRRTAEDADKPNPFSAKDKETARKLANMHPLAILLGSDIEPPQEGETWSCRYSTKDRKGLVLIERVQDPGPDDNLSVVSDGGGQSFCYKGSTATPARAAGAEFEGGTVGDYAPNSTSPLVKNVTWGGEPKKLMVGYSGVSPAGYWTKFRSDLESYIRTNYPELGFRIANLGVIRPLADSAASSNPDRADGSKHGAGLAQDLYLHTDTYGEYKSYKTWNPILAKDIRLVRLMRKFAADRPEIQWGGNFGGGTGDIVQGRGITEFHHYEFKDSVMPKYFAPYDAEIRRISGGSLAAADLTSTAMLAKLYKLL